MTLRSFVHILDIFSPRYDLHAPVIDTPDKIHGIQKRHLVGNDDHHSAARASSGHRLHKCCFPIRIKVGIGLIKDHQKGSAKQGAGKSHPLALSAGKRHARFTNAGSVTLREF